MRLGTIGIVFAKEVADNLRDRRSLLSALLYPLLGPLVFGVLLHLLAGVTSSQSAEVLPLPVFGAEHAPELTRVLEAHQFHLLQAPADAEDLVRRGRAPVALVISPGFAAELAAGGRGGLTLISDNARLDALAISSRLQAALQDYAGGVVAGRLARRGLDPQMAAPLDLSMVAVARQLRSAETLLTMIPAFLMFTLFIGGVYLAIDSISGERERGSLEPLLCHPVPRWHVLAGKSLAASLFSLVAVAFQLGCFHLLVSGRAELFQPGTGFGLAHILRLLPLLLPMLAMAVAVQMLVAILTRSYKEAQTWLGLLPLVPALPSIALSLAPGHAPAWLAAVPLLSQTVAMQGILLGQPPGIGQQVLGAAVTLATAAVLFVLAARRMEGEAMVFGAAG